ncbi:MAG TPA: hypothetical protein VHB46_20770 [Burkholderiales bacterium]|nr:hypothetical protein [Burkholderiales bacterium]
MYSKEHFAEIRRSKNPRVFLDTLDDIGAKRLEIDLTNWRFSGTATLTEGVSAKAAYEQYLAAVDEVPISTEALQILMAWLNGGASEDAVLRLPYAFDEQIKQLVSRLPPELVPNNPREVFEELALTISKMTVQGNSIEKTREALGVEKGAAGSVTGDDPIRQIWKIVAPNVAGLTCDQFFGFEPLEALDQSPWTAYEGIIRCCAVLDIVGYQAEKKSRDLEKIDNVMSDAAHIAAAAYCSAVISADRRFSRRAKAIYEFKKLSTASLILSDIS